MFGQVVRNPRIAEFDPSADHWQVLESAEPAVVRYDLEVYLAGASAPFATVDMGKPSPEADGKIRYNFLSSSAGWPLPGGEYEARVRAIGPEGSALSDPSNLFTLRSTPACTTSLSGTYAKIPASGGDYAVGVSTCIDCQWIATTDLAWVTIWTAGGIGDGTAAFQIKANASLSGRAGTVTIGDQIPHARAGRGSGA